MQEKTHFISNFFERISSIMDYYEIKSVKSFACKHLGYASSEKINRLKGRGTRPSYEILNDISNKFEDINVEWLLTGKGEMLKKDVSHLPVAKPAKQGEGIPLIPISALAGFGEGELQVLEYECERYVIPAFKEAEFLISVKGSSMYPKYSSGDIVACKKLPLRDIFFQWNKVYVLDTNQGALIKRIKRGKDENHILIVSENEKYEPFELHLSQINAVAIVIGVIRLE